MDNKMKLTIAAISLKKISAKILKKAKGIDFGASLDVIEDAMEVLYEASAIMDGEEGTMPASEQVDLAWVKARDVRDSIVNRCLSSVTREMVEVTDLIDQALEYLEYEAGIQIPSGKKGEMK